MQMETFWLGIKFYQNKLKGAALLMMPVALFFVPVEWLDAGHSICIFNNITGNECYGCGMTRAMLSALHFQFIEAYNYNPLFIIVLPLLIFIWLKTILRYFKIDGSNKAELLHTNK